MDSVLDKTWHFRCLRTRHAPQIREVCHKLINIAMTSHAHAYRGGLGQGEAGSSPPPNQYDAESLPLLVRKEIPMSPEWPVTPRRHHRKRVLYPLISVVALAATVAWLGHNAVTPLTASTGGGDDSGAWVMPSTPPHLVLMLADDQGWNDIGYQSTDLGSCTPHLDSLAAAGIKLTNYYGMPVW